MAVIRKISAAHATAVRVRCTHKSTYPTILHITYIINSLTIFIFFYIRIILIYYVKMQRTRTTYLTWSSIRVCVWIRFKSRTRSPTLTIVSEDMRTHTQTHVYTYIFILETCLRRNLFYILFHDAHAANVYTKRCHLATTHTPIVTTATSQDRRRRRPFFFRPVLSAPPSPPTHTIVMFYVRCNN